MKYRHKNIEKKWQKKWEETGIYKAADKARGKDNFYHLVMFPYPSGDIHIGHWYNFAPADVYARFKRMQGLNVMSPIGFDAFGLPAENAAIKNKIHPKTWTQKNVKKMRKQLKSIGNVYDWSREVVTCDPEYYKWTQWMFLQLYKAGLAYKGRVPANFCPSCKTVLANEQVVDGKCERCGTEVIQKEIEQWLFKISDYAQDLLEGLDEVDWPETTKIMQKNWIGKSQGWELKFQIKDSDRKIPVYTTRADTLFGCTYLVLAPENEIIRELKEKIENFKSVGKYIEESKKKTERERISEIKDKSGVELKGLKAVNPVNGREVPVFVADYVLMHYGTGAIMAVPGHDQRDWDFAKKYNLPIIKVIDSGDKNQPDPYEGEGTLVNSGRFDGMLSRQAEERIGQWLEKKGLARKKTHYKIRDWLISRQRYWGVPIPMIFCSKCGWQPLAEKDLPLPLPVVRDFRPGGEGKSPLAKSRKFVETECPKCGGKAERETDTMDTFVCSSWYYLRYADPSNPSRFASPEKIKTWLPVDMYIGGAEHIVLHLLYSRFFTKVLNKLGHLHFNEPFSALRHQGIILGPDGQKMSKSRGNVVDPKIQISKYGADSVRIYLCFMGPYSRGGSWNPNGIVGIYRFLNRAWDVCQNTLPGKIEDSDLEKLMHKTIKKVTQDIEKFRFNTAVSSLMVFINELQKKKNPPLDCVKNFLLLLAPFAPHFAEELWEKKGFEYSIHDELWPEYDRKLVKEEKVQIIIQINGRFRDRMEADPGLSEKDAGELTLSREKVKKWLAGKKIRKIVFVPDKLVNIVTD